MEQNNEQLNTEALIEDETKENYTPSDGTVAKRKRSKAWDIIVWAIIIVLAVAVFVRAFVISKVEVSGESMMETYHNEEIVIVNKLAKPSRGDVVVFYKKPVKSKFLGMFAGGDSVKEGGEYYKLIKRVVAIGGDKIWVEHIEDNKYRLVIETPDGEILHEDNYTKNKEKLSADCFILYDKEESGLGRLKDTTQQNPLVIEDGYFFAMGDNRVNSADSRGDLGPVPLSQLFGVVI